MTPNGDIASGLRTLAAHLAVCMQFAWGRFGWAFWVALAGTDVARRAAFAGALRAAFLTRAYRRQTPGPLPCGRTFCAARRGPAEAGIPIPRGRGDIRMTLALPLPFSKCSLIVKRTTPTSIPATIP